jgi:hypothetical protein
VATKEEPQDIIKSKKKHRKLTRTADNNERLEKVVEI